MESLTQSAQFVPGALRQRSRLVGWSLIASVVALVIVGEKPYFPASLAPLLLLAALVLFLGMVPVARWLASGTTARAERSATVARAAEYIGIGGVTIAIATAVLALPRWLPGLQAQILDTSSLGVIGIWLLIANTLAFRVRLLNRVLAILGALAGVGLLLSAVVMWVVLAAGDMGSLTPTLETIRMLGGYLGQAFYLIWALWLGIWLLVRRK